MWTTGVTVVIISMISDDCDSDVRSPMMADCCIIIDDERDRQIFTYLFPTDHTKAYKTKPQCPQPTKTTKIHTFSRNLAISQFHDRNRRWWWPIDASSPMMSVTDGRRRQRTNIIDLWEVLYAKGPKGQTDQHEVFRDQTLFVPVKTVSCSTQTLVGE